MHQKILERIGVHRVVQPERLSGNAAAQSLRAPALVDYLDFCQDGGIGKLTVPESWVGRTAGECKRLKAGRFPILVVRRGGETIPTPPDDFCLEAGDVLAILVHDDEIDELPRPVRPATP